MLSSVEIIRNRRRKIRTSGFVITVLKPDFAAGDKSRDELFINTGYFFNPLIFSTAKDLFL